jgi:hypothetical protein
VYLGFRANGVVNEYGCGGDEIKWNEIGGAYSTQREMNE